MIKVRNFSSDGKEISDISKVKPNKRINEAVYESVLKFRKEKNERTY